MEFIGGINPSVDWTTKVQFWSFQKNSTIGKKKIPEKENSSAIIVVNYNLLHVLFYLCIKVLARWQYVYKT